MEQSKSASGDQRVVLQFHIGDELSGYFFNARSRYRAQFRMDWRIGLEYNRKLIEGFRNDVASLPRANIFARRVSSEFEDCGALRLPGLKYLSRLPRSIKSLVSALTADRRKGTRRSPRLGSRALACALLMKLPGSHYTHDSDAWLDVKGAFVGSSGLYQPMDPIDRAKRLQASTVVSPDVV